MLRNIFIFTTGLSCKRLLTTVLLWFFGGSQKAEKLVVTDSEPIGYELTKQLSESEAPTDDDWSTFESVDKETWAHDPKAPKERSSI